MAETDAQLVADPKIKAAAEPPMTMTDAMDILEAHDIRPEDVADVMAALEMVASGGAEMEPEPEPVEPAGDQAMMDQMFASGRQR